jgi:integrase
MATFTKRGKKIRAQVCRNGHRESATFLSKAEAVAWAGRTEAAVIGGERGGAIPDLTFGDLLDRYKLEESPKKKGARWEAIRIAAVARDPIALVKLKDLDSRAVAGWRDRRLKTVTAGTVVREWTLLSTACGTAVGEWHWLRVNPFTRSAGAKRPVKPTHRTRLATEAELALIQAAVATPQQATVMLAARWGLETAMRSGEILGLTPGQVDVDRRVAHLVDTWASREDNGGQFTSIKNGAGRDVPLSPEAIRIWQETGCAGFDLSPEVRDVTWRNLCKKAGVKGLHFHDLRHTAVTRLAKKLQVMDLARMTGHKNLNQLLAYYNESAADIALKL